MNPQVPPYYNKHYLLFINSIYLEDEDGSISKARSAGSVTEKLLLQALKGHHLARPPFWFMRQAGRYLPEYRKLRERGPDFLSFCYTPELAMEATLQPLRRYHMDAAILFSDILVIPDALGRRVAFVEGEGPVLDPVRSADDIERLVIDDIERRLQPVFDTLSGLTAALPQDVTLIGFAGAPWTVAVYMIEGRSGSDCGRIRRWAYEQPETFGALMRVLTEATVRYLRRQIESGAEVIQLFDSWAGIASESLFRSWVMAPTVEIVSRLKAEFSHVPVVGFPRAAGALYRDYVTATAVDGVSIDAAVPLSWAAEALQSQCAVQGNLDNFLLAAGGEAMERETRRILDGLGSGPFVFNLGHGILPKTPPEHVALVAEIVRDWRQE